MTLRLGRLQRRECVVPTLRGWLVLFAVCIALSTGAVLGVYPFLSVNDPRPGGVLVTEGWGTEETMRDVLEEFRRNHYDGLFVTGGPMGMRVLYSPEPLLGFSFANPRGLYWLAAGMLLVSLLVVFLVQRSRFGRALVAVREDEVLAAFLGINVVGHKLAAYVMSSTMAAMIGTAYAPFMSFISPELLNAHETISLIGILILGGIGTLAGPIIGTLVFFGIPELFRVAQLYRLVILGAVIIVGVLFMPQGIAGLVRQRLKRWTRLAGTSPSDAARG